MELRRSPARGGTYRLVLKFRLEDSDDIVNSVFFKVGFLDKFFLWSVEHRLGSSATHILESFDNPSVDFVAKFVEIDILFVVVEVAVNIDFVAGEHRSEFDVQSAFTDSLSHLFLAEEHLGVFRLLVETDRGDFGRAEGALDEESGVGSVGNHIDVLVAELAHDTMDAATLHADASANRVDTVVV